MDRRNLASRAAHWSATHRKTAIWGWLAFVVVAVLVGNAVGQNQIHGADQFTGEADRAEQTLDDAGLRPNDENVLVQSKTLTIDDPEFRTTIEQVTAGSRRRRTSKNVEVAAREARRAGRCPPTSIRRWSSSRSPGDDLEAGSGSIRARTRSRPCRNDHPELLVEQFGNVSSNKELNETFTEDLLKAEMLSLPITLLILMIAFGIAGGGAACRCCSDLRP